MTINIPTWVYAVIDRLNQHGFEAYIVGGCVRDALLGFTAKDWDVCTNAEPGEMLTVFKDMRTIPTGIAHGTVTVLSEGNPIEITTFRIDGAYTDCRHPDGVSFTSRLSEDLARRDFTVNAMAYHPKTGLVDLFGGQQDLQNKLIRCVGKPTLRFTEDALRILRGLRFASVLGFSMDSETVRGMNECRGGMKYLARERVLTELSKLICGNHAQRIMWEHRHLLLEVLPHLTHVSAESCRAISSLPFDICLRLAALYYENPFALQAMIDLKTSKEIRQKVDLLVREAEKSSPDSLAQTRLTVGKIGFENFQHVLTLKKAFGHSVETMQKYLDCIKEQDLCCCVKELAVNGKDLLQLGVSGGERIGAILDQLLDHVVHERVANQKNFLLDLAIQLI